MKYTAWHLIITLLVAIILTIFVAISVSHSKTIKIEVQGLVCDFCAQSIAKLFGKEKSVEAIDVNLDKGMIKIDLKEGYKMDDTKITKLITDSGYNVEGINRIE